MDGKTRNIVPHNLIQACFQQFRTDKTEIKSEDYVDSVDSRMMTNVTEHRKQGHYVNGFNTMGLIVWSFVFGVIFNKMGEKGKILVEVVTVMNEAITAMIDMIMGYLPVGVMFMTASNVLEIDEWETIFKLGMFTAVVMTGLLIQAVIVLPLIYFIFTRCSPMAVIRGGFPALMTALTTSSSVTAAVASTGAALPATGAVTTLIVLAAVGVPAKEASTLGVVEWLLDHCITVINVMGNCYGASLIYRVSTQELELMTRRDAANLENIQINVSSQASDNDIFYSDVSQNEDIGLQIMRTLPECLSAQDSDDENV